MQQAEDKINRIFEEFDRDDMLLENDVYQYRKSHKSTLKILKDRRLRMAHYLELAPREIEYTLSHIKDKIPDTPWPELSNNPELSGLKTLWDALDWYIKKFDFFTSSLCLNKDDAYLWSRYGDNGSGFSIGVSKESFFLPILCQMVNGLRGRIR